MTASNSYTATSGTPAPFGSRLNTRHWLFFILNAIVLAMVTTGVLSNEHASVNLAVYTAVLFAICTLPLPFVSSFRGPESLLLVFLAYYFGAFGLKDLADLLAYEPLPKRISGGFFTDGENAILVGAMCFIAAYLAVVKLLPSRSRGVLNRDWSATAIALVGIVAWVLGFYVTASWQFGFGDRYSEATINTAIGGFVSLLRILQPLGSLLLIYLFLTTRNKLVLIILLGTMAADFGLGFVGDSKEIAIRGPLLYLFSLALLRERIPIVTTIAFVVIVGIAFNLFAAYREDLHSRHQSRQDAFNEIGSKLQTLSKHEIPLAKRLSEGVDYFASRITLKQNMEIILSGVGKNVAYQNGETITPLLYAFIPRFIAPNKPDTSAVGRTFNREFKISADPDTYISVGHVGELYWNYGWTGLITGMMLIGAFMAMLGSLLRLDKNPTLPKFLVLLITIYLLTLRFEAGIAMTYTVWARALVLLLILNAITPKRGDRPEFSHSQLASANITPPSSTRILKPTRRA